MGTNIAVLLDCSKSSRDSVAFLTYLLLSRMAAYLRLGGARGTLLNILVILLIYLSPARRLNTRNRVVARFRIWKNCRLSFPVVEAPAVLRVHLRQAGGDHLVRVGVRVRVRVSMTCVGRVWGI